MNEETIQYYNRHAEEFCAGTFSADMSRSRDRFLAYLQPGSAILDAGCGSGRDTLAFLSAGYQVDAFDASDEICRIASQKTGIPVRKQRFEKLEGEELYDGIWACASLLHVAAADLPDVLVRLYRLLKKQGIMYVSFKLGDGERQKDGRYFNDMREEVLCRLLCGAGFTVKETYITQDVRENRSDEAWVNVIAEKMSEGS
jgi:2-polyprenyl-3-methyl-5-hydroxy-6-metoxy-1,4-benzoquinol methylase